MLLDELLEAGHPSGEYAIARRLADCLGPTADLLEKLRRLEERYPFETLGIHESGKPTIAFREGVWNSIKWSGPPAQLAHLLRHPLARFVEELHVGNLDFLDEIARPPKLRFLVVEAADRLVGDRLLETLGSSRVIEHLEHLTIRGHAGPSALTSFRERLRRLTSKRPGLRINDSLTVPEPNPPRPLTRLPGAASIEVLEPLAAVRKRPGLFLGGTEERDLRRELVRAVAKIALERQTKAVLVELGLFGGALEIPNAHGDVLQLSQKMSEELSTLTEPEESPWTPLVPFNALSNSSCLEVSTGRRAVVRRAQGGQKFGPPEALERAGRRRMRFEFTFDPALLPRRDLCASDLASDLRKLAFVVPGVAFSLSDSSSGQRATFKSRQGLADFVKELQRGRRPATARAAATEESGDARAEVGLQWAKGSAPATLLSFVNGLPTPNGGSHLDGAMEGVLAGLEDAGLAIPERMRPAPASDFRKHACGLVLVVHARLERPRFLHSDRDELHNPEVRGIASAAARNAVGRLLAARPVAREPLLSMDERTR
ncbi:MAG: hypothetical protein QM765_31740 [Myxococcales bacterium]